MIYLTIIEKELKNKKETYTLISIDKSSKTNYIQPLEKGHNLNHLAHEIKKNGLLKLVLDESNELRRTYNKYLIRDNLPEYKDKKLKFINYIEYLKFKNKLKK